MTIKSKAAVKATREKRVAALVKARAARAANRAGVAKVTTKATKPTKAPPKPVAEDHSERAGPDPYYLTPDWRIIAHDKRQWGLERRSDAGDDDDERDAESGWTTAGYYPSIEGCCRLWAQRHARELSGGLPNVLAKVVARLESVLGELREATGGL
jgi:hypothetical protein